MKVAQHNGRGAQTMQHHRCYRAVASRSFLQCRNDKTMRLHRAPLMLARQGRDFPLCVRSALHLYGRSHKVWAKESTDELTEATGFINAGWKT
jgi:hypothetical protein